MAPKQPRYVAYLRVSTAKQGRSGLGLEAQREAVRSYVAGQHGKVIAPEYVEIESGKRNDRPELAKALKRCRVTGATLVVAKLDRLARNVAFIAALMESGAEFVACDFPQANRLTVHILAAVAEHEREMISVRTTAALAAAKAKGTILGNPHLKAGTKKTAATARAAHVAKADAAAQQYAEPIAEARTAGAVSLRQIAEHLNAASISTSRGSLWTATAVARVLARLGA